MTQGTEYNAFEEHRILLNKLAERKEDSWHQDNSEVLKKHLPQTKFENIVDIGSCGGSNLYNLGIEGERATLLDMAERQLDIARSKNKKRFKAIETVHVDLANDPEKILVNAPYDLVVCSHLIQHIEDEAKSERVLDKAIESLAPGGLMVFVVYKRRRHFGLVKEKRTGFFQGEDDKNLRVFFRRYTKDYVMKRMYGFECLFVDDTSTDQDILFIGRKKDLSEERARFFIKKDYTTNPLRIVEETHEKKPFWTDEYIRLSQFAQYYVYQRALQLAEEHQYKTVLDLGCGVGIMLNKFFLGTNLDVFGVDQPDGIQYCKDHYDNGTFIIEDFEEPKHELAAHHKAYDLMISADVIEHLENPLTLLNYMKHYAHKDSRIVISTPDRSKLGELNFSSPRNKNHIREWSLDEFNALLTDAGFIVEEHYNTFAHKLRPNRDLIHNILWKLKTKDHLRHTQVAVCRVKNA